MTRSTSSKVCKICGSSDVMEKRRLCKVCYLNKKKEAAKRRYIEHGRYLYKNVCMACKLEYDAWRKEQQLCRSCYRATKKNAGLNPYENAHGESYCWMHRRVAENILNRKLSSSEVVHHLDENPINNSADNLIVVSRVMHGKLHAYLRVQRVIIEKSMNENSENCWDTLIAPMTTAWLETTGAKVIKLWEIGQSAAEPLSIGEGSETMHGTPEQVELKVKI